MKKFLFLSLVVSVFTACVTDFTEDVIPMFSQTITVMPEEDDTRIQLLDGKAVWNEDDLVSVFDKTTGNEIWRCYDKTGSRVSHLTCKYDNNSNTAIDKTVLFYPHDSSNAYSVANDCVVSSFSDSQEYLKDSYGLKSSPMIGVADEKYNCVMRSVAGWLKLSLVGDTKIGRIVVKGNNGEALAGMAQFNAEHGTAELDAVNVTYSVTLGSFPDNPLLRATC